MPMSRQIQPGTRPPMPSKKKSAITLREAHRADIPALIELNKIAYPVLAAENVVWGERHLLSHQRIFPQGQIVAEIDGKIVGAAASLLVDLGPGPLRNHTWSGITHSGYFTKHNPPPPFPPPRRPTPPGNSPGR